MGKSLASEKIFLAPLISKSYLPPCYFEQSWKIFFTFAFNFVDFVAIVLILRTDQGYLTLGVSLLAFAC